MARRRAEAAVLVAEERFRHQREELAHALRVNTLGEFGVSLAHEINQPLTAITLNARAMSGLLSGRPRRAGSRGRGARRHRGRRAARERDHRPALPVQEAGA